MKKSNVVLLLACGYFGVAYCAEKDYELERAIVKGADASFLLCVVDDAGQPVADAKVHMLLGMNFRERANFVDGFTSTNGELKIGGKTTGNEIVFEVSKRGYYSSNLDMSLIARPGVGKVRKGKWQPWCERVEICLRKIVNPKPLKHFCCFKDVPQTNEWIGLDMKCGDWVHPYGNGVVSDIEINVKWDGLPKVSSRDCSMQVRMLGELCGGLFVDKVLESEFECVKSAPTNNVYSARCFDWVERENGVRQIEQSFWRKRDLVVRTRCKVDRFGRIIESFYGGIHLLEVTPGSHNHPILALACDFNPMSNEPNLEYAEVANRTYKRLEREHREKACFEKKRNELSVWGGIKKMFGAP